MLTRPPARLVGLSGPRKQRPPSPGRLVSRPGAVLPVGTVKGILTIHGMLEADELHLAGLAAGGLVLLALVVLLVGRFLAGMAATTSLLSLPDCSSSATIVGHNGS